AMTAAILSGLISLGMDLFFNASMDWYTGWTVIIVDVLVNIVFAAIVGAVVGWLLGRGGAAAA
ncbi:MAG: hypothetical protein R3330_06785, partial [Saprospiraceae bacterium]|nr:hypothetical protein [Saprospiraceae bacterium]